MNAKAVGGVLLVVGTCIGGGMLALPFALSDVGFAYGFCFFAFSWFVMFFAARLMLEVNLKFEPGSHLVTMAKETLGWPGKWIAWFLSLGLLYTLLSAYISGGRDVLGGVLNQFTLHCSNAICTIIFTAIFGGVVYAGIRTVDYVNRALMLGKLSVYLIVVLFLLPHINTKELAGGSLQAVPSNLMILITSFGFASIVPSLRYYFQDDIPLLRRVIFWGSIIPLFCYVIWLAAVMGVVSVPVLQQISHSTNPIADLMQVLEQRFEAGWIAACFTVFSVICILTAFLGVSLGLFDLIADGVHFKKRGFQGAVVFALTFLPPMFLVLINPGIYMMALSYAGIFCVLLLLVLPAAMAWRQRGAS